jgi:hypothetical protein
LVPGWRLLVFKLVRDKLTCRLPPPSLSLDQV